MEQKNIDLSQYQNTLSRKGQVIRLLWTIIWAVLASWLPRSLGRSWKLLLLRLFGAKVHPTAHVYSTAKVYMPWNLEMHEHSTLGPDVDCYNIDKIVIEANCIVSQKAFLCAASHDITKTDFPLVTKPIILKKGSWIGADAFIGFGVTVGEGAVVGARAAVFKAVEAWTVVGGNPAKFIKNRELING